MIASIIVNSTLLATRRNPEVEELEEEELEELLEGTMAAREVE